MTSLVLAQTPPSFNAVGYTGNRWQLTKAVKRWKQDLATMMMVEHLPRGLPFVTADVVLTFPDRRRRDVENYRVVISKALGDALQEYGAIPDDTAEFFRFGELELRVTPGRRQTEVVLHH